MTVPATPFAPHGLAGALAGPGWGVVPEFVPMELVRELLSDVARRERAGEFRAAAVGAGAHRAIRPEIRGDRICWLVAPASAAERALLERLEALRAELNRELMLGLAELECHYAIYAPGARYARHLDRSPLGFERVVSVVLYLNPGWRSADGGELVLATERGQIAIVPRAGALAAFMSQRLEHEVRVARRPRLSLTGWFRRRPPGGMPP